MNRFLDLLAWFILVAWFVVWGVFAYQNVYEIIVICVLLSAFGSMAWSVFRILEWRNCLTHSTGFRSVWFFYGLLKIGDTLVHSVHRHGSACPSTRQTYGIYCKRNAIPSTRLAPCLLFTPIVAPVTFSPKYGVIRTLNWMPLTETNSSLMTGEIRPWISETMIKWTLRILVPRFQGRLLRR